jgi:hypothetical protein
MEMHPVYLFLDRYLIWFYRLTGRAEVDFFLGTLALACITLLVGEFTSWLAASVVRRHFTEVAEETKKFHDLSLEALKAGDRPAFEAANQVANEVFSKSFFMQMALSASFFWPIFFALGWMQNRFQEVEFPLPWVDLRLSYVGAFVPLYIAAYLLFKIVKKRLLPAAPGQAPQPQGTSAP